jgi:type VI secretion system protein ImpC
VNEPPAESTDDVLKRLLGRPRSEAADLGATSAKSSPVDAFIRRIVAANPAIQAHPERAQLVAAVEAELTGKMRKILHHPAFQAIEANWRGLDFLLRNIEIDEDIEVWLWDISKDELGMDLGNAKSPEASLFYRRCIGHAPDSTAESPWAAIVGLYHFTPAQTDIELLQGLATLADKADASFLAAADYETWNTSFIAGTQDTGLSHLWNRLRRTPEAARIGLLVPRFLLRLPYGQDTDPIDEFKFEEWDDGETRRPYLWGNPALVTACLLGQSFNQSGWDFAAGDLNELEGLPAHVYREDGESRMTPCAEVWFSDTEAEEWAAQGFIPLRSIRGRDAVRIDRFQSLHMPPLSLKGRWE